MAIRKVRKPERTKLTFPEIDHIRLYLLAMMERFQNGADSCEAMAEYAPDSPEYLNHFMYYINAVKATKYLLAECHKSFVLPQHTEY